MTYPLTLSGNTGVTIRFNTSSDNVSVMSIYPQNLPSNVMISGYEVKVYIPGCKCDTLKIQFVCMHFTYSSSP